jgi:(S)-3,5-dihydroxyphenylglycine transaminase
MTATINQALRREQLHPAIGDPKGDSMRLLAETAIKFPDALSFSAGAPYDGNHDLAKLPYYLDRYLRHLREQGVAEKRIEKLLFQYGPVNGFIQDEVARMLKQDEHIDVPAAAVMLTNGCQEALLVALRGLYSSPDDVLLTSIPAYVGILGAARMLEIPVQGVTEGPDGLDPDEIAAAARSARAAGRKPVALYVIPDFSNPAGTRMSLETRRRLLKMAAEEHLLILEDNAYGLFARDGDELPTLKSMDTNGSVIYIGSFAKSAFPGARLGFLVADQTVTGPDGVRMLAEDLSKAKSMFSIGTSSLSQAIVGGILVEHDYNLRAATRELAEVYLERLTSTVDSLTAHFPPDRYERHRVRWNVPQGGFFLTVEVGFRADLAAMERCARDYGVSWAPMSMFFPEGGGDNLMRLGFSTLAPTDIREAIARLARFITDSTPERP